MRDQAPTLSAPAPATAVVGMDGQASLRSWLAVGSVGVGVFAFVTTEFIPVGLIPQIAKGLGVSIGAAGLMLTLPGLLSAFFAPALILLAGRIDRRVLLLTLLGLLVGSNMVSALSPNFALMMAGRALLGLCLGGYWTVALAAGARLVPPVQQTRAVSIMMSGMTCATVIGLPLGTWIGSMLTWRAAFATTAVLAGAALCAQALLVPTLPSTTAVKMADFRRLLRRKATLASLGLGALLFAANIASYTYLAPFLETVSVFGRNAITPVLLGFGVIGFLANLGVAPLVAVHPKRVLVLMIGIMAATMALLPIVALSHVGVIGVLVVWAVPFGAVPLCLNAWALQSAPDRPEAVSSLFISTVQLSIALGSSFAAGLVAVFGVPANIWLGSGLAVVGLVLVGLSRGATPEVVHS